MHAGYKNRNKTAILILLPVWQTLMRPRSAPVIAGMPALPDDEVELGGQFDQETSNNVLTDLEERIRVFHEKHGGDNTAVRNTSQVAELRRFAVQVCGQAHSG